MNECPECKEQFEGDAKTCPNDGAELVAVPSPLLGQVLGERYKIVAALGEGGMGQVFVAEHVILGKKLAVKVLRAEFNRHPDLVARFQQEAVAASQIGQENIVDVSDFGRMPDGSFYFVMEHIPGQSLANLIDTSGALPFGRALPLLLQVTRALDAAHGRGIIHRDLKPDNVIVSPRPDGSDLVKVLDFGISKVGEGRTGTRLTQVGMVVGTPQYMSPEQATGDPVDNRADIYAFGVMAYEVFTGTLPFSADNAIGVLLKHQNERPQPPRERRPDLGIDPEVEALILHCMAKRREDRPQSMAEIGAELVGLMGRLGVAGLFTPVPIAATGGMPRPWTDPSVPTSALAATSEGNARTMVRPLAEAGARGQTSVNDAQLAGLHGSSRGALIGGISALLVLLVGGYFALARPKPSEELRPAVTPPLPAVAATAPTPPPTPAPLPAPVVPAPPPAEKRVRKVSVTSEPAGAKVTGRSGMLGVTPLTIELPEGTGETLKVRASGYRTAMREVSTTDTEVKVTLSKAPPKTNVQPGDTSTDDDPYGKVDDLKTPY
jgi:eukaryotic-like serine/threonine-protein kinase